MSARIHVFRGPTISRDEVLGVLPHAIVHPPVRSGDLAGVRWRPGDVAAIIDGLFLQAPAVRHREIVTLLGQGVVVCGASSMGALRAAELGGLGMIGVGVVHRLYALGVIDRDDEVAISHTPAEEGWRPLSVALVSVRVAARRARRLGLIDAGHERRIVDAAAAMPFALRGWRAITAAAGRDGGEPGQCAAFLDHCLATAPDVKRDDARRLLREVAYGRIARRAARRPAPPEARFETHYQQLWELRGRGERVAGAFVSELDALSALQLVSADFPDFYRRLCLQLIAADRAGAAFTALSDAPGAEIAERALDAARALGLGGKIPRRALTHHGVADPADLLTLLVRSYRHAPGAIPRTQALDLLRGTPAFTAACELAGGARRYLAELTAKNPRFRAERVTSQAVARLLDRIWATGYRLGAARDRGLPSSQVVERAARPLVPYLLRGDARVPELGLRDDLPAGWWAGLQGPARERAPVGGPA